MNIYFRLLRYAKPHIPLLIVGVIVSSIVGGLNGYYAKILNEYLTNLIETPDKDALLFVTLIFVGCSIGSAFFRYIADYIFYHIAARLIQTLRNEFYTRILCLPIDFYEEFNTGEIISRLSNDIASMQAAVTTLARDATKNFVTVIFLLGYMIMLSPFWTAMIFICTPIVILPMRLIGKRIKRYSHTILKRSADQTVVAEETCVGHRVVKGFQLEQSLSNRYKNITEEQYKATMKSVKYSEMARPLTQIIVTVPLALATYYLGIDVINHKFSAANYLTFLAIGGMLQNPTKLLGAMFAKVQTSIAAAERVFSIVDRKDEPYTDGIVPKTDFQNKIQFKNLGFQYPESQTAALNNIDLEIHKGKIVALVGSSGAGKTTLADLLPRFYEPTSGSLLLDDLELSQLNLKWLRSQIAVVTQHTFLFDDTIANNIAFGAGRKVTINEIENAAKAAEAHEFIEEMELKYDTPIGEQGLRLSGGQRQRIAIARAIVRNAPILILDEATSALDTRSERLVQHALENLMQSRTVLVVAHRLSTIKNADMIVVMDSGKIIDRGTHNELLQRCENYTELCRIQAIA